MNNATQTLPITISKDEGKHFCVTGIFSIDRKAIVSFFEQHGFVLAGHVTKKTNFLVVGKDPGSYLAAAKSRGVTLLFEDTIKSMMLV